MNQANRGFVVELVGPSGSGKSSLNDYLLKRSPRIIGESYPTVKNIASIPFYLKNIFSLIPIILRLLIYGNESITLKELTYMAVLNGWYEILRKKADDEKKVIILDQGPIFMMAYITMFGSHNHDQAILKKWWSGVIDKWKQNLDMLVYLDTSSETLIQRIRNRQDQVIRHVNGKPDQDAYKFISSYRNNFEEIILKFSSGSPRIRIVRIDSGVHPINEISIMVINEIETFI